MQDQEIIILRKRQVFSSSSLSFFLSILFIGPVQLSIAVTVLRSTHTHTHTHTHIHTHLAVFPRLDGVFTKDPGHAVCYIGSDHVLRLLHAEQGRDLAAQEREHATCVCANRREMNKSTQNISPPLERRNDLSHTHTHTNTHTLSLSWPLYLLHTCAYIHTYTHPCKHTYIHTYIHTIGRARQVDSLHAEARIVLQDKERGETCDEEHFRGLRL